MNKVKWITEESYTYEFELDRLLTLSGLSVSQKNCIVELVNKRDFKALKAEIKIYGGYGEAFNGNELYMECVNWPNYIKLESYKEEQEVNDKEQEEEDDEKEKW